MTRQTIALEREPAHHLLTVLRAKINDPVVLFNGDGYDYRGRLLHGSKTETVVEIQSRRRNTAESALRLTLAQGVTRGNRMDYSLQKAVELGVKRIVPVICERTQVKLSGARLARRVDHWRAVVIAACEQCGRASVPEVEPIRRLTVWLDEVVETDATKLVLAPDASMTLCQVSPAKEVTILIGPEGGLSEAELAQAKQSGFTAIRLGPRTLRTETAGPASLAALQALWGDLG